MLCLRYNSSSFIGSYLHNMQSVLLAQKGKTSQQYDSKSRRIPATELSISRVCLADIKTKDGHGYNALKLAFGESKRLDKPTEGMLKKKGVEKTPLFVQEIRLKENDSQRMTIQKENDVNSLKCGETVFAIGSVLDPNVMFKVGDMVDVTGTSKGKGFQGVVKRHGFKGGPKTHGQSDRWRSPGAMGMTTTPGRTFKGKRMGGRMGGEKVTIKNLEIVAVTDSVVTVKGLIPGITGSRLVLRLVQEAK